MAPSLQCKSCCVKLIHPAHTSAARGRERNEGIFCSQGVRENWECEDISKDAQKNKTAKSQARDFLETYCITLTTTEPTPALTT